MFKEKSNVARTHACHASSSNPHKNNHSILKQHSIHGSLEWSYNVSMD